MRNNLNFLETKNSETEDSVYLYNPKNKDLYSKVLDQFNESDCIFSRNLMAYLEDRGRSDGSFYSKHIPHCVSCQTKASEYKEIQRKISKAIPNQQMSDESFSMIKAEINEAQGIFDPNVIARINFLATLRKSLIEFFSGFFTSREIIFGFSLACLFVLIALVIN